VPELKQKNGCLLDQKRYTKPEMGVVHSFPAAPEEEEEAEALSIPRVFLQLGIFLPSHTLLLSSTKNSSSCNLSATLAAF